MTTTRFRFMDLLVTVSIALGMLGVCIAARQNAQSASDIANCAANLRQIHTAIGAYIAETGEFPRTRYEPDAPTTAYTQTPDANDVTAAIFLLAKTQSLSASVFNCPAALRNGLAQVDTFDQSTVKQRTNFKARINYNYSLANMYPSPQVVAAGYDLTRPDAKLALASDTNPGHETTASATTQMTVREVREGNSPNHQRDGQNILFADGSVIYSPTPFVRDGADNIFASSGDYPQPANALDAVLLPVWSDGPNLVPAGLTLRRWVFSIALVGSTLLLIFIVLKGRRKEVSAPNKR